MPNSALSRAPVASRSRRSGVALLIIDMQADFVLPPSPVRVAGAEGTLPLVRSLLEEGRSRNWDIFHVIRRHAKDGSDAEPYRRHFFWAGRGICVEGTEGCAIVPGLEPAHGEHILVKKRFSAFFNTDLEEILRGLGIRTVIVSGTQYPNCVRGTAMDALARDFQVIVVTDACSAADEETADANIRDMQNMGIICTPFVLLDSALMAAAHPVSPERDLA